MERQMILACRLRHTFIKNENRINSITISLGLTHFTVILICYLHQRLKQFFLADQNYGLRRYNKQPLIEIQLVTNVLVETIRVKIKLVENLIQL